MLPLSTDSLMLPVFLSGGLKQGKYDVALYATGMPNASISSMRTPETESTHRGSQETRILLPGQLLRQIPYSHGASICSSIKGDG